MVETDTPKVSAISWRGIPRSTAASTLSLRSFEYALMSAVLHGVKLKQAAVRNRLKRGLEAVARYDAGHDEKSIPD